MMTWFQPGHVAIVTGGSRGLGKELARELLARNLRVIVDGRDPTTLDRLRETLGDPRDLIAIAGDVSDRKHAHALIAAAQSFGRLDLLVNNASTLGEVPLPRIDQLTHETFAHLFDVNLYAPIHLAQHALPLMQGSGEPATIVNVTSDAALEAYPTWGGYGATKAALEHVSRVLCEEMAGSTVRILVADPGDMNTQMHRDAIPADDPGELRDPADSARSLLAAIAAMKAPFERVRLADGAIA